MSNKKLLIIADNPLDIVGGIETYNNELIQIISNNFDNIEIHIAILHLNELKKPYEKYNQKNIYYHFFEYGSLISKNIFKKLVFHFTFKKKLNDFLDNLNKKYRFRIIINSTLAYFKNVSKLDNFFLIQHNDPTLYWRNKIYPIRYKFLFHTINFYLIHFEKIRNLVKKSKNIVVFDFNNYQIFKRYTKSNLFIISLFSKDIINDNKINLPFLERKKILYLGRISQPDKNILDLIKINKKINLIDFYGLPSFTDGDFLKNILINNGWYKGYTTNNVEKFKIVNEHKFLIIYSNYEGFPFSLLEALSCGVPIIVKNSFASASYLCNKDTGLLLSKNSNIEEDISEIIKFNNMSDNEYIKLSLSARQFYEENLTEDIFKKKWIEILKKFL